MITHGVTAVEMLLVEDDRATARMVMEALKGCAVPLNLSVARNGEQALAMLHCHGIHSEAPRPALILLDLHLPKKDGFAVLSDVKADPRLKHIPIAVFTSSALPGDILRSYELGANCYIVKPRDLAPFLSVIRLTIDFWCTAATLPIE